MRMNTELRAGNGPPRTQCAHVYLGKNERKKGASRKRRRQKNANVFVNIAVLLLK